MKSRPALPVPPVKTKKLPAREDVVGAEWSTGVESVAGIHDLEQKRLGVENEFEAYLYKVA